MTDAKRIHFHTGDPSPSLRCRLFGHDYLTATAYEDVDDWPDGEKVEVCRRCYSLKGRTWEGIYALRTNGGPSGRDR